MRLALASRQLFWSKALFLNRSFFTRKLSLATKVNSGLKYRGPDFDKGPKRFYTAINRLLEDTREALFSHLNSRDY